MAAPGRQLDEAIDQRRGDHARRDTVGKAAGAGEHSVHFIGAQMDLEPTGLECLGDAIKPRRQIDGELGEVDAELLQTLRDPGGRHA